MAHPRRSRTAHVSFALLTLGMLWAIAGCDRTESEEPSPADGAPPPGAATYEVAIAEVLGRPDEPGADPPTDPLPVVYLVPLDDAMGIDDQASVIDFFATSHDVRFVDDLAAAIDVETPGSPPRDAATVLAVGAVDPHPPHLLRIEQYHTAADIDATLLTLAYVVDRWVVTAAESVPAEALTDVG